jgi:outer membrane lipoprotein-sorting protein
MRITCTLIALLLSVLALGQSQPAAPPGQPMANPADLASVLRLMDQTAKNFSSAQADFVWDQYDSVVNAHDKQEGKIYFRRHKSHNKVELQMGAHIFKPEKFVVYSGDLVRLYEPRINQVTEYSTAKNKSQFESFLVLGFGGSGADLKTNFTLRALGGEAVDGIPTAKLELIPKDEKARNVFAKIYLWIDLQRGVSLRQMFMEPNSGNYRDALYRNIKLNQKIPDDNFKLKLPDKVQKVTPQG